MKITFIMPCVGRKPDCNEYVKGWLMEPLAVAMLSALTPEHISREFFDDRLEPIDYDTGTDLVAVNVETYTARRAYQIAGEYRRRGIPVVMGGFHATLCPDEVEQYAECVAVGSAEATWPRILSDFENGRLAQRYSGGNNSFAGVFPDRTIYADKRYTGVTLIETGRGCRFSCEFCSISPFFRKKYYARPVDEVVGEIRQRKNRFVFFIDDNIMVDRARTLTLLRALVPLRIEWIGQVSLNLARDPEMLSLMKQSGCAGVLIGFESLNRDNLTAMGKQINYSMGDYDSAAATLRKAGLGVYATFVFGYDGDTIDTFQRTLAFAKRSKFFFAAFNQLVPFPGTPLYRRLMSNGSLRDEKWWLSEQRTFGEVVFEPRQLSPDDLAETCLAYRKKFYRPDSVLYRASNVQSNCSSLAKTLIYFSQSVIGRKDVLRRQGLPFGIPGVPVEKRAAKPISVGAERQECICS